MSSINIKTNFLDKGGGDLGNNLITKDYLLSVYPSIADKIGLSAQLWTWGSDSDGQLGINNYETANRSTPVQVLSNAYNWKQVSAGYEYSAAIASDGTLWTWGVGGEGALGNANPFDLNLTPGTTILGGSDWKQVNSGFRHTAAIKTDGTLWLWGGGTNEDTISSLGRGEDYYFYRSTPVTTFAGGTNWADTATGAAEELYTISAGKQHGLAIKTDGTLWVWGNNQFSSLGINVVGNKLIDTNAYIVSVPITTFVGGTNWKQISNSSQGAVAAVKTDGTLWVWGNNDLNNLGTSLLLVSTPVTTFAGGTNWSHTSTDLPQDLYTISAAGNQSAAIKTDGTLWIWGFNTSARLGINALGVRSTPVTTFSGGTNWKEISLGSNHTAAIKTDGTLWLWGAGGSSILGNISTTNRSTPITTFVGGNNWKQISLSSAHSLAIKTDGTLWSWGIAPSTLLGRSNYSTTISTPVTTFAGGTNWADTATGAAEELYTMCVSGGASFGVVNSEFAAAIKTDGTLWVWGYNDSGQLGVNSTNGTSTPITTFAGGTNWKQISLGFQHAAAIKTDGTLWVWGNGSRGKLGTGETTNKLTPVTTFSGGTDWKQISASDNHTAAIKTDGTLWAWGWSSSGRLGNNDSILVINVLTPITTFAGGTDWKQVSCGVNHTAAVKTDGTLWTWGNSSDGMLGNNTTTPSILTPITTFAGGTDWKQVSCGAIYTAAIKTNGTLWAWGNNANTNSGPVLGTGDTANKLTPVTTFAGGTDWKQVSAGLVTGATAAGSRATAAVKTDGTLWVWGNNADGKLGINSASIWVSTPVTTFAGGTNWRQASTGLRTTIGLKGNGSNNELYLFGNGSAALGNNYFNIDQIPTKVNETSDWSILDANESNAAAIKTDGTLWVWGSNGFAQIGNNSNTYRTTPVTTFAGGTDWKQVSCGSRNIAAVKTDGTLWIWGNNFRGQLGLNDTIPRSTPVTTFAGGTDWKQVSCGDIHIAAVKTNGTLWTWGSNAHGQLAQNDAPNRLTPVTTFAGGTNWKQVKCSYNNTIALRSDGVNNQIFLFGNNFAGSLGIPNDTQIHYPVELPSRFTSWKQVSCSRTHTAAIKTDGTLWAWGNNDSGQIGNALGSLSGSTTPVTTFAGGTDWKQVSCSNRHTAAIKTNGTLWVWGNSFKGRHGNRVASSTSVSTPITTFAGGIDWKQVSSNETSVAAVKTDGTLWLWGENTSGLLGIGGGITGNIVSTPVTTFAGGSNWKQVSCAERYTGAVKTDGTLWLWGFGFRGQLGNSILDTRYTPVTTFVGGTNWKQVSCGYDHTMALSDDGVNKRLFLFGRRDHLGVKIIQYSGFNPEQEVGKSLWKQVSCGRYHTAAIKTDGTLCTWGLNYNGVLGNNTTTDSYTPVTTFLGGKDWKQVDCGDYSISAIKTDGTLWSWGYGASLGNNIKYDAEYRSTPVTTFAGGTNWADTATGAPEELYTISAASSYNSGTVCAAVKTDGTLWSWGNSSSLGNGESSYGFKLTPVTTFAGGTNWKQISCSYSQISAIKTDGTLWTWGAQFDARLGNNYTTSPAGRIYTPITTFAGGTDWKQVSSGYSATGAIKTDGTLWIWGYNINGQVGNNDLFGSAVYTPVTTFAGGTNWKQISCGGYNTAAVKTDGTLWIWGALFYGALGIGDALDSVATPVTTFAGGTNWKQVSVSPSHVGAVKTDGTLWLWGSNYAGALGIGFLNLEISTPVTTFAGGTNWKQVSCGGLLSNRYGSHTAAIKTDGTLWTWGYGSWGQLGTIDFPGEYQYTPITTFAGGTDWKQVSAGNKCTLAIKGNNQLYVFGNNPYIAVNHSYICETPITTFAGGNNWKQVTNGQYSTHAIKTDGTLWVWGWSREVGINTSSFSVYTPVTTFAGGTDWKQVNPGSAIKIDGTLWVWGNNKNGQLGVNDSIDRLTPITTFAGGTNWTQISSTKDSQNQHRIAIRHLELQ